MWRTVFLVSARNCTGTMQKWSAQVGPVLANVGRELSLLKMAIDMVNADYLSFFLWNELEPRCQQRAAGSLELYHAETTSCHRQDLPSTFTTNMESHGLPLLNLGEVDATKRTQEKQTFSYKFHVTLFKYYGRICCLAWGIISIWVTILCYVACAPSDAKIFECDVHIFWCRYTHSYTRIYIHMQLSYLVTFDTLTAIKPA